MEPGWNPKLEQQALDRVYRLGQQRPVRAVYYIAQTHGSVDEVSFSSLCTVKEYNTLLTQRSAIFS